MPLPPPSFVRKLSERSQALLKAFKAATGQSVDGIVPVCHSEGGSAPGANNFPFLTNVLTGWAVHPNVGAVLAVEAAPHHDGTGTVVTWADIVDRAKLSGRGGLPPYSRACVCV